MELTREGNTLYPEPELLFAHNEMIYNLLTKALLDFKIVTEDFKVGISFDESGFKYWAEDSDTNYMHPYLEVINPIDEELAMAKLEIAIKLANKFSDISAIR